MSDLDGSWTTTETDSVNFSVREEDDHSTAHAQQDTAASVEKSTTTRVRFAEMECEEKEVEHFDDPKLWWKRRELNEIRSQCLDVVNFNQKGARALASTTTIFLNGGWKDDARCSRRIMMQMSQCTEIRGLEHYVVPETNKLMQSHVQTVVQTQATSENKMDSRQLRKVARASSKATRELAIQRAQHDRKIAQKAMLTPWHRESA